MWPQKPNKLDDRKNFQFLKRGIGIKSKSMQQVTDQKSMETS